MEQSDKDFIEQQFKTVNQKMDLIISPLKCDVAEIKSVVNIHTDKISILELFKEGHQAHHIEKLNNKKEKVSASRFYWEILVGSGFIGGLLIYFMK